jgi:hypothetical protein
MKFKEKNLVSEFNRVVPKLKHVGYYIDGVLRSFDTELVVTHVFRTREMQEDLYRWKVEAGIYQDVSQIPDSVHQYWRGFDFRTHNLSILELHYLYENVNFYWPYGKRKIKTLIVEPVGNFERLLSGGSRKNNPVTHCHVQSLGD